MLNTALLQQIVQVLEKYHNKPVKTKEATGVGGGCINEAHRIETSAGFYFVKHNSARRYPGMFLAEAKGLEYLKSSNTLDVPEVIGYDNAGDDAFLVLEYISSGRGCHDFWEDFGRGLANMHLHPKAMDKSKAESTSASKTVVGDDKGPGDSTRKISFGFDHNNYIGSLPQSNKWHPTWIDFFVAERLEEQLKLARDEGRAGKDLSAMFQKAYRHLTDFFPEEPPALLHGDLWSGNFMTGNNGQAVIIDPAVYLGHRYMDLGMSKLFGGFSAAFYEAYNQTYPLEKSWQKSMDIANLYPLMVHVNLFGGGYINSVKSILRPFN